MTTKTKPDPKKPVKALVAGVVTFCSATGLALPDGVTVGEWLAIVPATLIAVVGVYGIPNPQVPDEG